MSSTSTSASSILNPDQVAQLVIQPLIAESVATLASTVIDQLGPSLRIPVVTADPTAAWVAEGAEITVSDPTLTEVDITPHKLAGLVAVSSELIDDANPNAMAVVGDGLVRDLRRKLDSAYFGNTTTNGPAGLGSLTSTAVSAGTAWENLDPFAEAISNGEKNHTQVTTFACSPETALELAKLKDFDTSNRPLLGPDPTQPGSRSILGVPLLVSPAIADDIVWAIPRSHSVVGLRRSANVVIDTSAYFSSDRIAVRATLRIGLGFTNQAAVSKITLSA